MEIQRALPADLDRLYQFILGKQNLPVALTRSYLWENVQPQYFISILFTTKGNRLENVFYHFSDGDDHVIEEWVVDSDTREEAHAGLLSMFEGPVAINLISHQFGDQKHWPLLSKRREMVLDTNRWSAETHAGCVPDSSLDEPIRRLLAQEWWTDAQARQFLRVTNANPDGVNVVVVENGDVVAFAHAACDTSAAWINAVYVDASHRSQGKGRQVLTSLITKLKGRGIEKVGLGVGEENSRAVELYRNLGFSFTEFIRWRFQVRPSA